MFDVALQKGGGRVVLATSSDSDFPPDNIIDGNPDTFWTTTGRYPQEFVISFQSMMKINELSLKSFNVRQLLIQTSAQSELDLKDFETCDRVRELDHTENSTQNEEIQLNEVKAQHIKLTILSAYDHFCSVNKVSVNGQALH